MNKTEKPYIAAGGVLIVLFFLWTVLIQCVDVAPAGVNGTNIGFAGLNTWFHQLTGVHLEFYVMTDWLSIIPFLVCIGFGALGAFQLVSRKSLFKVDADIILLGAYYIIVIMAFLLFNVITINYRPILIDGKMEGSYPSSTTLLVLSVMPTLILQAGRRVANASLRIAISGITVLFILFMVGGRIIAGVHWLSDIIGGVLLSIGLFLMYKGLVGKIRR